uniref:trypsin n=1 Tax=Fundulus heteroclitus TaxID=8078 RepID=A0A3Q2Q497_FUNHE
MPLQQRRLSWRSEEAADHHVTALKLFSPFHSEKKIIKRSFLIAPPISAQPDSGGPLVAQAEGLWWLVGDGVWGEHCNGHNKPGVYTNIAHHLNWIYHQMQKHQDA